MNWLAGFFALSLGWFPSGAAAFYNADVAPFIHDGQVVTVELENIYNLQNAFFVGLEAEAEMFGFLFIGGEAQIFMRASTLFNYLPQSLSSVVWAGVRWGMFDLRYHHTCTHPIVPAGLYQVPLTGLDWTASALILTIKREF